MKLEDIFAVAIRNKREFTVVLRSCYFIDNFLFSYE